MNTKVKTFLAYHLQNLENEINNFIEQNSLIEVIDIKYQVYVVGEIIDYTALMIYKGKNNL